LDAESGLYYYRSRPFDPFTGKFIQEDKIGFAGGDTNLSRYVFNQPISNIDPNGFESRELSALFSNSSKPLNIRTNTALTYNTKFPKISEAYAYAAVWFDAITTGLLGSSNKNPLGEIVFRDLKDDTGLLAPPIAGRATLRAFSTNRKGSNQGNPEPTIDLSKDDFKRTHGTPGYLIIDEVKFSYKDKDKDPKDCNFLPKNVSEQEEREKARIAVGNIIAAYPQRQRTPESQPRQNFTPPNIDFGEIGRSILGIPGAAIRELFRGKV
jgi:RHS repeat-associated protein